MAPQGGNVNGAAGSRWLVVILIVAAVLRVGLLAAAWNNPAGVKTDDTRDYVTLSDNLAHNGSFDRGGQAEIFRTPGYPFFLLVGSLGDGQNWWHTVLIIQIALDVLLVYMTYLLGWLLLDRRVGLWAAALQAVSDVAIASSDRVLSDGLFAFLLTLSVLLVVYHLRSGRRWAVLASAAVLGAGCYVRPVGQVYLAILAGFLLLRAIRSFWIDRAANGLQSSGPGSAKKSAAMVNLAMFALVAIALTGPWVVRNMVRADFRGFSSFAGDSVFFFAAPEVLVHTRQITSAQAREEMKAIDQQDERSHGPRTPGAAARFRQQYARQIIAEHPGLYAWLHVRGTVGFFLPGASDVLEIAGQTSGGRGTSDVLRQQGVAAAVKHYFGGNWGAMAIAAPLVAIVIFKYLGALVWVVRRLRLSLPMEWWLVIVLIVVSSLLGGPYGFPRYRVPAEPLLSILAGAGWACVIGCGSRRGPSVQRD